MPGVQLPGPERDLDELFLFELNRKVQKDRTISLLGVVYDQRFEKYAKGRSKGQEDTGSHYRRGVGGDWVNHFEPEHVARFKERHGDLLLKLGYESDPDWNVPALGSI